MKKLVSFLRSMRFGLILMVLVLVCSLIGSILPQGQALDWYERNMPAFVSVVQALTLHTIFSSWYFVLLMAMLCLNLTLCSVSRVKNARTTHKSALDNAKKMEPEKNLTQQQRNVLIKHLNAKKYRVTAVEGMTLFHKNTLGHYGSFLVHLSFLLILVVGALTIYLSKTEDYTVFPGHSLRLTEGDVLNVESFRITDETGHLDFRSVIRIDALDGTSSGSREISVNEPFSYKSYKYYQQSYGTAGAITAVNQETGGSDDFLLTEPVFLSADGKNGIWYEALYPGYVRDEEGHFTLITSTEGAYTDPVYQISTMSGGVMTPVLAFPGDVVEVNGLSFTFRAPVDYPGIRVKHTSPVLLSVLYGVFALMVFGFWLCFFHVPAVAAVTPSGYALYGAKTAGLQLDLDLLFEHREDV